MILDATHIYERLKDDFPEVEAFKVPFYEATSPDCSEGKVIDLANAIFESVGKSAWSRIPSSPTDGVIEKASLRKILENARDYFSANDTDYYDEIYNALVSSAMRILGKRNACGDISHGHLHTKNTVFPAHASMSLNLALSFAAYYFQITEYVSEKISYDDHKEEGGFNEWLNERGDPIGGASYSYLLYQHDYARYESYLDEFELEQDG